MRVTKKVVVEVYLLDSTAPTVGNTAQIGLFSHSLVVAILYSAAHYNFSP